MTIYLLLHYHADEVDTTAFITLSDAQFTADGIASEYGYDSFEALNNDLEDNTIEIRELEVKGY